MEFNREAFAPLFRDLLHLEITLVSHSFTDRASVPEPDVQVKDIMESYTASLQEANQPPAQSAAVVGPAFEALETVNSSPRTEPDRSITSFAGIAAYAENTLSEIQNQRPAPDAAAPTLEIFGGEAADDEQDEAKPRRLIIELDPQQQKVMRIRDNARHIDQLLKDMGYETPQPPETGQPLAGAEALETVETPASGNQRGGTKGTQWTPGGIMQIRKYWEIRPEDGVLMRTVIGMDGDVVVHINPAIVGEDFKNLHQLHDQSVATSVRFWKELAGILSDFVNNVIKSLVKS
jgi:hypothetical protein